MRNIVSGSEGLNTMLNEIVNHEMNKTIDGMIEVVKTWQNTTDVVSCESIITMLKANKTT